MTVSNQQSKFLIIDGNAFFYRAYYGSINLSRNTVKNYNAVYTAIRMLKKLFPNDHSYQKLFFAFDRGKKTFRHQALPSYKGQRKKTPEELFTQMKIFREFLAINKITVLENDEFEADDLIASLAKHAIQNHHQIDIISSDRDLLQVIRPDIQLLMLKTGVSQMMIVNHENFFDKYHLTPKQMIDFKALCGDVSDNLKGIQGIGPKMALKLLAKYRDLPTIYQHLEELPQILQTKLITDKEQALLTQKMVKIKNNIPLNVSFTTQKYDFFSQPNKNFYLKYQMFSLLRQTQSHLNQKNFKF